MECKKSEKTISIIKPDAEKKEKSMFFTNKIDKITKILKEDLEGNAYEQIGEICQQEIEKNPEFINKLFLKLFAIGGNFKKDPKKQGLLLFQFIRFLVSRKYLPGFTNPYHDKVEQITNLYLEDFKTLLETLLQTENFIIKPKRKSRNDVGYMADNMFFLYRTCIKDYKKRSQIKSQISGYALPIIKQFPSSLHYTCIDFLQYQENAVDELGIALHIAIENEHADNIYSVCSNMINPFDKSDFIYKNGAKILTQTFENIKDFPNALKVLFLKEMLDILGISKYSQQERIASSKNSIKHWQEDNYFELEKKERQHLKKLENSFEQVLKEDWQKAYKKLAVSTKAHKIFTLLTKEYKGCEEVKTITKLLEEAKAFKTKPKKFELNTKPQTMFKDFGFKLWVISELMYRQQIVQPKFSLEAFASEYTKREIDRESDGYEIIPEVQKFFKNLDISKELLEKVETITIDETGLDCPYEDMWPFFDPGSGDELLKVSNKMVEDLELLPNLKKIVGLEVLKPPAKLLKALRDKKIELEESCSN